MIPLPEQQIRDIANGLNGVSSKLGQWQRDLMLARAVEAAARRQALEDAQSDLAQALCDDCENGVKWLNEKAAKDFAEKYPHLSAAIRSLIDKDTA